MTTRPSPATHVSSSDRATPRSRERFPERPSGLKFHERLQTLTRDGTDAQRGLVERDRRRPSGAESVSRTELSGRSVSEIKGGQGGTGTTGERLSERTDEHQRSGQSSQEAPATDAPPPLWCDPIARALLQWSPPTPAACVPTVGTVAPVMLDQIATQLVRKVGVGGGSVHLQFAAGRLDGGALLVQSGTDGLDVQITAPPGVDATELAAAICERLERRGLRVSRIAVD